MIIAGTFSFNGGEEFISRKYKHLLNDISAIISAVDANEHKTKRSREKTMPDRITAPSR